MRQKPGTTAILFLVALMLLPDFSPFLAAQDNQAPPPPQGGQAAPADQGPPPPPPTAAQLDQLLAPVALYPDSLLSQITTASTNPQEILDVANWLQNNSGLTGSALTDAAQQAGFDPAFIALVTFPTVVSMMADNVDDYAAIGQAFTADQASVAASIQRLRAQAYAAGTLQSNAQQKVEVQTPAPNQTVYVIQPANPQVVYVPQYNPTVVYVQQPSTSTVVAASLISFGAGIAIGALMVNNQPWGWGGWGWNWSSHRAYYNHTVWVGWGNPYRPPNYWYRPRPVPYYGRPGYGGNWGYRPPNYRPPYQSRPPGYRPPYSPSNPPGQRPPNYRPPANTKPVPKPYNPGNPKPGGGNRPPTSPGTKPAPQPGRPGNQNPGGGGGGRPSNPGTNPSPQPKPVRTG